MNLTMKMPANTAARLEVAFTERLMPPVRMVIIMASERTPSSGS